MRLIPGSGQGRILGVVTYLTIQTECFTHSVNEMNFGTEGKGMEWKGKGKGKGKVLKRESFLSTFCLVRLFLSVDWDVGGWYVGGCV